MNRILIANIGNKEEERFTLVHTYELNILVSHQIQLLAAHTKRGG